MTDPESETSSSGAVTSEGVESQMRAVTDPLTQQLAHLCELMKDLRDAQTLRRHEEAASSRAIGSCTSSTSITDTHILQVIALLKTQCGSFCG